MDNYLGEIRLFAGNFAPSGWALCNGQALSISDNEALYTLVGTTYGGDGVNTFNLPDLQGRLPVGQGQGTGLSSRPLGQQGGEENHTLAQTELPQHSHSASVTTSVASTISVGSSVVYGTVTPNGNTYALYTTLTPPDVTATQMAANAVGLAGGSQPHDNTMFTTPINFIIALSGIYPSQN